MALTVKKVVVTEVAVTTVKIDVNAAIVLDAAGEKIQCANAVNWLPAQLDIDIETGVIRNWSVPTGEQLQHTENADDLLLDALEPSVAAQAAQEWRGMESAPKDGTCVLVIDSEYGDHSGAFVAQYSQHSFSGCWLTSHTPHVVCPTHWMPLPTPPQEQSHD